MPFKSYDPETYEPIHSGEDKLDEPVNYAKKIYHLLVGVIVVIVGVNIIVGLVAWWFIFSYAQTVAHY